MLTRARKIHLTQLSKEHRATMQRLCYHSARLYNFALYQVRQHYFAQRSEGVEQPSYLSKYSNHYRCKDNENYLIVGKNCGELLLALVDQNYRSFFAALKKTDRENPINLPGYLDTEGYFHYITQIGNGFTVKDRNIQIGLSKTLLKEGVERIMVPRPDDIPADAIREVRIIPNQQATDFNAIIVYRTEGKTTQDSNQNILGIDIGVNNLAACVAPEIQDAFLIDGRYLKSLNRYFNKEYARLKHEQMKQDHRPQHAITDRMIARMEKKAFPQGLIDRVQAINGQTFKTANAVIEALAMTPEECQLWKKDLIPLTTAKRRYKNTKAMIRLCENRNNQIRAYLLKSSTTIVQYCVTHAITKIVVGLNEEWKQNVNLGKQGNQNFVQIPFATFRKMIQDACERQGIHYEEVRESHTSKCSFLDNETIEHHKAYVGKRIKRGLFQTATGKIINADVNGAANIAVRGGWNGDRTGNTQYLTQPIKLPMAGKRNQAEMPVTNSGVDCDAWEQQASKVIINNDLQREDCDAKKIVASEISIPSKSEQHSGCG